MECLKIGILGSVDSGKSTFVGVLKTDKLDDGRGLLRKYVMKHNHELESGRTSCISYNTITIIYYNIFYFHNFYFLFIYKDKKKISYYQIFFMLFFNYILSFINRSTTLLTTFT